MHIQPYFMGFFQEALWLQIKIKHWTLCEYDFQTNRTQSHRLNPIECNPLDCARLSLATKLKINTIQWITFNCVTELQWINSLEQRSCYGNKQKMMHYVVSKTHTKNMCSTKVRIFQVFGGTREHDHFISREQEIFLELIGENKGISTTKGNFDNKV